MQVQPFRVAYEMNGSISVICPTLIRDEKNNKTYLVDAGYAETVDLFQEHLAEMGIPIEEIDAIIVSHEDIDHVGGLSRIKEINPDLEIWSTGYVASMVSGKQKSERLRQLEAVDNSGSEQQKSWKTGMISRLNKVGKVAVNKTFEEGDKIGDELMVVATPGHTSGHVSFFHPATGVLIANDALGIRNGQLDLLSPQYTIDREAALKSVRKLKALNPQTIICYHGGIVLHDAQAMLDDLLSRYN